MDRRQSNNPCHIKTLNDRAKTVREMKGTFYEIGNYEFVSQQEVNANDFYDKYSQVVALLTEAGVPKSAQRLTYTLLPIFGEQSTGLRDSRVGGFPGLSRYFDYTLAINKRQHEEEGKPLQTLDYFLDRWWPKCSCCHRSMAFVGQFDVHPWAAPIYEATSWRMGTDFPWEVSGLGSKRMIEHGSIHADHLLHIFMCPQAGEHFDNPNSDCIMYITKANRPDCHSEKNRDLAADNQRFEEVFRNSSHVNDVFGSIKEIGADNAGKQIVGYDLRFEFDHGRGRFENYSLCDKLEDISESHPELFSHYTRCDYKLFGEARSQQEPRRYWASKSVEPRVMTPTLHFNDDHADFTYQLYFDLIGSDGYTAYGKVDGSCT